MRRRKSKQLTIEHLEITKMAAEGRGIGYHDGKIIFVDYAVPGDIVKVQTTKNKKDYAIASILEVIQPSEIRQEPVCEHFGVCGGCRWLHVPYDKQLAFKQQQVEEIFSKLGDLDFPPILPVLGAPEAYHYRNKMEYTFSDSGWLTSEQIQSGKRYDRRALGFHVPGRFDGVLNIYQCHLQDSLGDDIRNHIRDIALEKNYEFYSVRKHEGFLRNLIMRNNVQGEWMVTLSVAHEDMPAIEYILDSLVAQFPQITSLNYVINPKKNDTLYDLEIINYHGQAYLTETLDNIQYKIGPKSFFQTNSQQAKHLYDVVRRMATIDHQDTVYDLYTGTGSIALYVAQSAKHVIGIETVSEAIEDAKFNMELNQITNTTFIDASVENILDQKFIARYGKPQVVITDPPRVGMHAKVVEILLEAAPQQIVYVSCNPATQARDLKLLAEKYDIVEVQPVDMFPNTYHIENVVNLKLRA